MGPVVLDAAILGRKLLVLRSGAGIEPTATNHSHESKCFDSNAARVTEGKSESAPSLHSGYPQDLTGFIRLDASDRHAGNMGANAFPHLDAHVARRNGFIGPLLDRTRRFIEQLACRIDIKNTVIQAAFDNLPEGVVARTVPRTVLVPRFIPCHRRSVRLAVLAGLLADFGRWELHKGYLCIKDGKMSVFNYQFSRNQRRMRSTIDPSTVSWRPYWGSSSDRSHT